MLKHIVFAIIMLCPFLFENVTAQTLSNNGAFIRINASTNMAVKGDNTADLTNSGTIRLKSGDSFIIDGSLNNINSGAIHVNSATLLVKQDLINDNSFFYDTTSTITIENNIENTGTSLLHSTGTINIDGNFLNDVGARFASDGNVLIQGNWTNNGKDSIWIVGNKASEVSFIGVALQTIDGTSNTIFEKIKLNNVNGIDLQVDATTDSLFSFINGKVYTNANKFIMSNNNHLAIIGYDSLRYISGNLRRYVYDTTYWIPIGDNVNYERAYIEFKQLSGLNYIDIHFNTDNAVAVPSGITVNNKNIDTFLDYGYWSMTADAGTFTYDFTTFSKGHTNGGGTADQYSLISKFPAQDWASNATHSLASQYVCPAFIYAKRTNLTEMGDFIIGKNATENLYDQPVINSELVNNGAKIRIKTGTYVYSVGTNGYVRNTNNAKISMEASSRLYGQNLLNSGSTINAKSARISMTADIYNYNSGINDTLGYIYMMNLYNDTNALFKTSGYAYCNSHVNNNNNSTIMLDSVMEVRRNWINNANPDVSYGDLTKRGEVRFAYTAIQFITGTSSTYFENVTINNPTTVAAFIDTRIDSVLLFTQGILETRNNAKIIVTNKNNDVIVGYDSTKYIFGNLRRYVKNTDYVLPIGASTSYQKAYILFKTISGLNYIDVKFTTATLTPPVGLTVNNKTINEFLNNGYWTIQPDAGTFTYDLVLTAKGYSNGGGTPDQYSLISKFTPPGVWANNAIHSTGTQIVDPNFTIAKRTNFQTFGEFIIGKSNVPLYDQPLITKELLNKKAKIRAAANNLIYVVGNQALINNNDTAKIYLNNNCTLSVSGILNNYNHSNITQFTGKIFADSIVSYKSRLDQTTGVINVNYNVRNDSSYITQTTGTTNIGGNLTNNNYSVIESKGVVNLDGNLYNNANCSLLIDSIIYIKGNWVNNGRDSLRVYSTTTIPSNVVFTGTALQTISGSSQSKFEKITIDNAANVSLSRNIHIDNCLVFNDGKIVTNNYYAIVNNTPPSSIIGYDTINNYVVGNLRRYVTNNIYDLPIGTLTKSEPAKIEILSNTGLEYIDTKFLEDNTQVPPGFLTVNGKLVNEFLDYGYWVIAPNSSWSAVLYNMTINSTGHTNGGGEPDQYYVISDVGVGWENYATHSPATQYFQGSYISAKRSDYQNFGYYIIGRSFEPAYNQPTITNELYNNGAKLRMAASTNVAVKGINADLYNVNNAKIHIKDNANLVIDGDLFNTSSLIDQLKGNLTVDSNIVNDFATIQQTTGNITTTTGSFTNKNNSTFQSQGIVHIKTDITNTVNSSLRFDSLVYIEGNWYNSARDSVRIYGGVKCSVVFNGSNTQYIDGDVETVFENINIVNNSNLALKRTQHVDNFLIFNQGQLVTDTAKIVVTYTDTTAIRGYDSLRYINGNLRRYVTNKNYFIPVGTSDKYELAQFELLSSTGVNYIDVNFTQDGSVAPPSFLLVNGILISEFLNYGYWTITPNLGWTAANYNLNLQSFGHSNGGGTPDLYALISDFGSDWGNYGNHSTTTQQILGEYIIARRAALTDFGRYVIGKSITDAYTQPLITNELYNKGAKIKLAANNIMYVKGENANFKNIENGKVTLNNTTTFDVNGYIYANHSIITQTTGTINVNGSLVNDTSSLSQTTGTINIQNQLHNDSSIITQTTGTINVYGDFYNSNFAEMQSQGTIFVDSNFYNQSNSAVKMDGAFRIKGNWNNDAQDVINYTGPNKSTVEFNGTVKQYISGSVNTKFENIKINNPEGVSIDLNTYVDSMLYFTNGKLYAENDTIILTDKDVNIINNYDSLKYIVGNMRRYVNNNIYYLPVGTIDNYELAKIEILSNTALDYIDVAFTQTSLETPPPTLVINGALVNEFLDYGYWNVIQNTGATGMFNLTVQSLGHSNGGGTPDNYSVITDTTSGWMDFGVHSTATQQILGEYIIAKRSNIYQFGRFIIGKSIDDAYIQPAITNELNIKGAKFRSAASNTIHIKGLNANMNILNAKVYLNNAVVLNVNGNIYNANSDFEYLTGSVTALNNLLNDTSDFTLSTGTLTVGGNVINNLSNVTQTTGTINITGTLTNNNNTLFTSAGTVNLDSSFFNNSNSRLKIDATFNIKGDWENNAYDSVRLYGGTKGTVVFKGNRTQVIYGTTETVFENFTINNVTGVTVDTTLHIDEELAFTSGVIKTNNDNYIIVSNSSITAITGYDSIRYINGKLRRYVTGTNIYNFPVGCETDFERAIVEVNSSSSLNYIDMFFVDQEQIPPPTLVVNGALVNEFLNKGYWLAQTNSGAIINYNMSLYSRGHSNGGGTPDNYSVITDTTNDWENIGVHSSATQMFVGNSIMAKRSNIIRIGNYAIGKSIDDAYAQPVITNELNVRGAKFRSAASNTIYVKGVDANMNITNNAKVYLNNAVVLNVNGNIYNANSDFEYFTGSVTALNNLQNDTSDFSLSTGTLTVGGNVINNLSNITQTTGTINITGTLTNNNNSLFTSAGTVNLDSSLYNNSNSKLKIDATFNIKGDWENNAYDSVRLYGGTKGTVVFKGNRTQVIYGTSETVFENFTINNNYGVTVDTTLHIDEVLTFTSGVVKTNDDNFVIVSNSSISAITGYDSIRYINGKLRRYVTNNIYNFPVGCETDFERAIVEVNSSTALTYIDIFFVDQEQTPPPTLVVNGALVQEFLNKGYWIANTNTGATLNYNMSLYSRGHSNGGGTPDNYAVITDTTNGWENIGVHSPATQMFIGNSILAKRSNIIKIGNYAIGKAVESPYTQPLINNSFVNNGAKLKLHKGNVYVLGTNAAMVNEISGTTSIDSTCYLYVNGSIENYNSATYKVNGQIAFIGNWINDATASVAMTSNRNGIVEFKGSQTQEVSGTTITQFEKVIINNANNINLAQSFKTDSLLTFTVGKIITNTDTVMINTSNVNAIAGYDSSKYIIGNLKRNVTNASYNFPIGTTEYYELANVNITASTNLTSVNANFQYDNNQLPPVGLMAGGVKPIGMLLNYGYWNITPNNDWTAATYNVILRSIGHTNGGGLPTDYAVASEYSTQSEWSDNGTHSDLTQSFSWIGVIAQRNALSNFGKFILGRNDTLLIPITNNLVNINAVLKTATDGRISAESNNTNLYNLDNANLIVETNSEVNIQGSIYNLTNSRIGVDGDIKITGNWINNAIQNTKLYDEVNKGTVSFIGVNVQSIKGELSTIFENIIVNNVNNVNNDTNTFVTNSLTFTNGKINSVSDTLFVTNTSVSAIIGYDTVKYINGNLSRYVTTGSYYFPIGNATNYELASVNVKSATNLNYINANFIISNQNPIIGTINVNNVAITEYLDYGYWNITSDNNNYSSSFDVFVQSKGHTNGGGNPDNYAVITDTTNSWMDLGYHSTTTQNIFGNFINATRFNLSRFGKFIIAKSPASLYNQPIVTRTVNNIASLIKIQGNTPITINEGTNGHLYNIQNATIKINDGGLAVSGNIYNNNSAIYQRATYLNVTGDYINQNAEYQLIDGTNSVASNIYLYNSNYTQSTTATTNITLNIYNDTNSIAQLFGTTNITQNVYNYNNARIKLNGTINLNGTWTNNAFDSIRYYDDPAVSNVNFVGSANQIINGTSQTVFENITLNNVAGLTLQNNAHVDNTLTFTNGKIFTNVDTIIVNNSIENAIIGFDETKYISGNLRRFINTGIYNFPVGTDNYYEIAQVEIISASSLNYLDVCYVNNNENPIPVGLTVLTTPMSEFLDYGYWRIIPDAIPTVNYNINLSNSGHTNGGGSQDMYAVISNIGAGWVDYAYHSTTTQYLSGDFVNASRLGLSQFGNFIIAKSLSPIFNYIPITNSLHNKGANIKAKVNQVAINGSNAHLKLTNNSTIKVQDNSNFNVYGTANSANSLIETNNGNMYFAGNFTNDTAQYIINGGTSTFISNFTNNTATMTNNAGLINYANVYNNNASAIYAIDKIIVNNNLYNYANASIYIDDTIILKGNFLNNGTNSLNYISANIGTMEFNGSGAQVISGTSKTIFENARLNNPLGLTLQNDAYINNIFTFSNGKLFTLTDTLIINNTSLTAITGFDSTKYISGNLRRFVTTGTYNFPVGTSNYYELAQTEIISASNLNYLDVCYVNANENPIPVGLNVLGTPMSEFLDYGYWKIVPDAIPTVRYNVNLSNAGQTNGGGSQDMYAVISNIGAGWVDYAYHSTTTQSFNGSFVNASRLGLSKFGNFIVAKSLSPIFTYIPITNALHNKGVSIKTKINQVAINGSNANLKLTNNSTIKVQDNSDFNVYGTANSSNSLIETNNGDMYFTDNFTNDTARYVINGGTSTFLGNFINNKASITNNSGLINYANVYNNNVSAIYAFDKIIINNNLYNYVDASVYIEDTIVAKGNILNNGRDSLHYTLFGNKGTVQFNGVATQNISGTSRTIFENIVINNNSNVNLSKSSIIDNNLTFTIGKINTQVDTLIFTNTDIGAIEGYDSTKYIIGNLRRYVTDNQYDLPIGSSAKYELANIQIINSTNLDYLDVKFNVSNQNPVPAGILVNGAEITEFLNYGYWTILANPGATSLHVIQLHSLGHTNGGLQPENYAVISDTTNGWMDFGYHSTSTQYFFANYIVAARSALNNFGNFIIGRSPYQFYIQPPITNELRVKNTTLKTASAKISISGINAVLNNYNNATIKNYIASTFIVNGIINNNNSSIYNYGILNTTADIINYDNAYIYNSDLINVSANINNNQSSEIVNIDSMNVLGYIINDTLSSINIDGVINLKGNFTNNAETSLVFGDNSSRGTIVFNGTVSQYISGTTITNFENIRIDNANGLALTNDAIINNQLYFNNGKLNTYLYKVVIANSDTMAIQGYSEAKYIIGNLRRYIAQKNYNIPIGTDNYYQLANLNILNTTTATYLDIQYVISSVILPAPGITIGSKLYNECLDYGYWEITPDVIPVPDISYNLMIQAAGHNNGGGLPVDYAIISDVNDGLGWKSLGTHNDASQTFYLSYIQARRTSMNKLGRFIVAKASDPSIPLIVNTLYNKGVVLKSIDDTMRISGISAGYTNSDYANMLVNDVAVVFVDGSIINNSYSSIYIDGKIMLKNNWTNNANATIKRNDGSRGTVEFCGDSLQDVCGTAQTIFENFVVNNSGKGIRLRANIKVKDTLLMQDGDLNLSSYVINMDTSGQLIGETFANRVKATDGANTEGLGLGNIRRVQYINNITAEDVAGIGVEVTTAGDLGWVTIIRGHKKEFINGTYSINRYYDFTPQNQGINTTLLIKYFDIEALTQTGPEDSIVMVHYHDAQWNPLFTFRDASVNKFWASTNTFSKFTGTTDIEQPLPVEMLYFNAYLNNENVICTWKTLTESNSDYFIVERSKDMVNFEQIGTVRAAGNSNSIVEYNFSDDTPYKGISYYRLKQYDFDGKYKYSNTAVIEIKEKGEVDGITNIVVYPNPTNRGMGINIMFRNEHFMKNVNIMMFDNTGKVIMNNSLDISEFGNINIMPYINSDLERGLYFIRIIYNNKVESRKVIIH
ncbi:MAG: hypothetical protein UR28_C0024G0001 [Candidatus Peregrinibacteria bacterium GW2011_GWF2_33_10]|nr:MAG: hypothetical protein UR28_C0024G0001 [Candidatus Peregrinibacteria bacterium GW2011_GWF2_33_10]